MKWFTTASRETDIEVATKACMDAIRDALGDGSPDVLLVFPSAHYIPAADKLSELLWQGLEPEHMIGCCGGGVIGGGEEHERAPALTMTAAKLPGVTARTFHLEARREIDLEPALLTEQIGLPAENGPSLILLPDPYTFPAELFVKALDMVYPFSQKVGGLVSGSNTPGRHVMFLDDEVIRSGLVGIGFDGNMAMDTIVAQGCRPVGEPMFVTSSRENVIISLDGRSPRDVLQALFESLDEGDRELVRYSLFLGIEMNPDEVVNERGDFLIRNILGMHEDGYLEVGARIQSNSVVQFHLRDRHASVEDLESQLERYAGAAKSEPPSGALLFSCLGRGHQFFGTPDHDSKMLQRYLGPGLPVGGFFCNGEIGPVQGTTYIHGYTSSLALFRRREVGSAEGEQEK